MRWQKKLTKKEMKHVKESMDHRPTLTGIINNRAHQKEMKGEGGIEPCYECRSIAIKLGLES